VTESGSVGADAGRRLPLKLACLQLEVSGEGAEEPHEQDAEGEDGDDHSGADEHLVVALLTDGAVEG